MQKAQLPRPVLLCLATFLSLTILSGLQLFIFHLSHPLIDSLDLLFPGLWKGWDILCFQGRFYYFRTADFFDYLGQPFNYPAPIALVLAAIYRLPFTSPHIFLVAFLTWVITSGALFVRACARLGVDAGEAATFTAAMVLLGFPTLLLLFLCNLELLVWVVLSIGVWAFCTRRNWLAAICFGIAASLKYFPLLFLGIFPLRKEWPRIVAGVATCVASLFLSTWILGPSLRIAIAGLRADTQTFAEHYLEHWLHTENGVDHSLFALMKATLLHVHHLDLVPKALPIYTATVFVGFVATYFLFIRRLPALNQLIAISIAAVWIAPLSHDYTLVNLYAPCGALTLYAIEKPAARGLNAMFICIGVVFASLTFVQFRGIAYGGQIRCLALGLLFALVLRYEMPWLALDEGRA